LVHREAARGVNLENLCIIGKSFPNRSILLFGYSYMDDMFPLGLITSAQGAFQKQAFLPFPIVTLVKL
jgi:hypothetical protein